MRNSSDRQQSERFQGHLRHYHRTGSPPQRTWDEWVDGRPTAPKSSVKWLKLAAIVASGLALAGIAAGLIIELQ